MADVANPTAKLPKNTALQSPPSQTVAPSAIAPEHSLSLTPEFLTDDTLLASIDWTDLAVLQGRNSPLGRAVRRAQIHFPDEEISDAMYGQSKTVTLAMVGTEPVFLNAAMVADVLVREFEFSAIQH